MTRACNAFLAAARSCADWSTERRLELAPEPVLEVMELAPEPVLEVLEAVAAPACSGTSCAPEVLEGFIGALNAEYVDGVDCGVGNFLDSGVDTGDLEVDMYEARVRGAQDSAAEVAAIRAELGLADD